jgi:hypothetical protein
MRQQILQQLVDYFGYEEEPDESDLELDMSDLFYKYGGLNMFVKIHEYILMNGSKECI